MDPNDVFMQFLELCNHRTGFFQHHLASNAVLEWFGKTIRGSHRIKNYYRYDLSQQYEHHFENVQQCGAFETKPTHFQTKQIPPEDIKSQKNAFKRSEPITFMEFKTPEQDRNSPKLPQLNQGRFFRLITDDFSDSELSELGLSGIQEAVTPPKAIEPVEKKVKKTADKIEKNNLIQDSSDSDMMSNDDGEDKLEQIEQCGTSRMCEISNDDADSGQSSSTSVETFLRDNNYSDLMYLEVVGILRLIDKPKHRSVRNSSFSNNIKITTTNNSKELEETPTSSSSWGDRQTRLKISYRINKIDNQIQFALIIYERLTFNIIARRNLIEEFEKVDIEDNEISKELKRKKPIKRALRL